MTTKSVLAHRERLTPKYLTLLAAMLAVLITFAVLAAIRAVKHPDETDFQYFYYAAYGVVNGEHLYTVGEQFTGVRWYAYLPLFAIVLSPLVPLGVGTAGAVWAFVSAAILGACIWIASSQAIRRLGMHASPNLVVGVAMLVVLVFGDKIRGELRLGQSDAFVMIWVMLGLLWLEKRPMLAGFMLGGSVNVKLQGMVFLPYLIVRGRWKNLVGLVSGSLFFAFVGVLIWGWARNLEYLGTVLGWVGQLVGVESGVEQSELYPLEWIRSVSIPSVMARAQLRFDLPESFVMLATAGLVGFVVALGWAMYKLRGVALFKGRFGATESSSAQRRGIVGLEYAGLLVGVLVFSPQSTVRHLLLSVFVVALGSAILHSGVSIAKKIPIGVLMAMYGAAITFPPAKNLEALNWWRGVGGASWVLLGLYFSVLWVGLGIVRELPLDRDSDARGVVDA